MIWKIGKRVFILQLSTPQRQNTSNSLGSYGQCQITLRVCSFCHETASQKREDQIKEEKEGYH